MITVALADNVIIYNGQSEKIALKIALVYVEYSNYSPKITKTTKTGESELLHWRQQPTWYRIVKGE